MSPVAFTWSSVPIHVVDFEGSARTGVVEFGVATLLGGGVTLDSREGEGTTVRLAFQLVS